MTGREIVRMAAERAIDKKALDPVVLDVTNKAAYTDFLLIVSGRSDRQLEAMADGIVEGLAEHGLRPLGVEGAGTHWILIDYGELVVHAFLHAVREFYDLEGLWADAARVPLDVPPESRLSAADAY